MNIAIILAGGLGNRFGNEIPKQFTEVLGKPLIVYALEIYENSKYIDAIEVVCIPEYMETVRGYTKTYGINKLKWVVPGGKSCQESTKNGIYALESICSEDDILIFGMSTSIFVDDDIISDSIDVCRRHGNAFAASQCVYNLALTEDGIVSHKINYKEIHKTLNLPWTAPFGALFRLYKNAWKENIETGQASYMPTLFLAMGETLYLSKDTSKNLIHVTTPYDIDIVMGCLLASKLKSGEMKFEIFDGD